MIRNRTRAILLAVALIGGCIPIAAQGTTRSISLRRDVLIGGQLVSKGDYSIKFIEDKDGELVFMKGSREVAKAPYKLASLEKPASDTAVIYAVAENGSFKLKRIEFKGYASALTVE